MSECHICWMKRKIMWSKKNLLNLFSGLKKQNMVDIMWKEDLDNILKMLISTRNT